VNNRRRDADDNIIVTDAWLKDRNFTDNWIARHATACGVIARRPRRFLLSRVLAHLDELADRSVAKANGRGKGKRVAKQTVKEVFGEITRKKEQKAATSGSGVISFADYYRSTKEGGK
jgi:hypothetical protein